MLAAYSYDITAITSSLLPLLVFALPFELCTVGMYVFLPLLFLLFCIAKISPQLHEKVSDSNEGWDNKKTMTECKMKKH